MSNKETVKAIIRERARKSRAKKYTIPDQQLKDADWLWAQYFCDKGSNNAQQRWSLTFRTGFSDRYLQKLIDVLNRTGRMVCNAMDGNGYFAPKYLDEALPYILSENHRKRSSESKLNALLNAADRIPIRPGMEDIDQDGEIQQTAL